MTMKRFGHYEEIPIELRREDATVVAIMSAVIAGTLCIGGWVGDEPTYFGWAGVVLLAGAGLATHFFRKKQAFVADPESQTALYDEEIKELADAAEERDQAEGPRWRRYVLLGVNIAKGLGLLALDLVKKLASLIIGGLIILAVMGAFAAAPIPMAILIGALIIAGAVSR
jgi:hypothetical protein